MHILVLFTGGTIGCKLQGEWLSPNENSKRQLLDLFQKTQDTKVQFSVLSPYEILSENLSASHLNTLIDHIENTDKTYDGIILTHGTDSLQYTAAALSFCLTKNLPVVIVSAAYPLEDKRSNGLKNFCAAVRFLEQSPPAGVYVSYQNKGAKTASIHLGSRLLSHAEGSADLYSFGSPYPRISTQKTAKNPPLPPVQPVHGVGKVNFCPRPKILSIECCPEKIYPTDAGNYEAILLSPYHSGTLNTASQAFVEFCKAAQKAGVPIFVSDLFPAGNYESKSAYQDLGITPIPMTKISLFVKCWLAISLGKKGTDLHGFILAPLANEFLD